MHPKEHEEQFTADLLRSMYRLGYIDFPTLDKMIDELQRENIITAGTIGFDTAVSEASFEGRALGDSKAKDDLKVIIKSLMDEK